jgi:uncharacterized small protein (TIGR04563 family)
MKENKRAVKRPAGTPPGPRSIYLGALYGDIQKEARRLDRSASWLLRTAWTMALPEIKKMAPKPRA